LNARISTGVPGLDDLLQGGLLSRRAYLLSGAPGTGKTLFGLQFLTRQEDNGPTLFVTFTESEQHLREDAEAAGIAGIDSGRIEFLDLTADAEMFAEVQSYDIFSPAEVEREPIARTIRTRIEEVNPRRIFMDGISELRMISADLFHFIRIMQSFFRFVTARDCTLIVSATEGVMDGEIALQSLTDGVIRLTGRTYRTLEVLKMRGSNFIPGLHPLRITSAGLEIYREAA
jgi:circadian clock protein KaiC